MMPVAAEVVDRKEQGSAYAGFMTPPDMFRPVPFWWWVGEPLERQRLLWQLDELRSRGVLNTVVSYNHKPDGTSDHGDPEVFSAEWWELCRWVVSECRKRGMKISFQDYTLLNPVLQRIGRDTPGMKGGQLKVASVVAEAGTTCRLAVEPGGQVVTASACPVADGTAVAAERIDLTGSVSNGELAWYVPAGSWLVSLVYSVPNRFDPLHPLAGSRVVEEYYGQFEANCPGELGRTIPILFQDELDFGAQMPLWSDRLAGEFERRKKYDLVPLLPALWHDLGPVTAKVRIDYSDVVATLLEENYFIPVFRWAEAHGVLLANDNSGRGLIEEGRKTYCDYFRTMRWFHAPGCDDPRIDYPRAFKGLKVNSSIAHLYRRPRVWNECLHSSGWGVTPARVIAALNEDFAYGATVVNLHGLYYTTYGGWWEWASPDFHFRQPYWQHMGRFNDYVSRVCFLLSQGVHACDVAIVYPITAIEAGLNRTIPDPLTGTISYSETQAGKTAAEYNEAEAHAFGLGRSLTDAGIDFDFIDFQSLEKAEIHDGRLCVSGEEYRVLILSAMAAARFSTLQVAREFQKKGGMVIAYGCLPVASEKRGSHDDELDYLVGEIFDDSTANHGLFIREGYEEVKQAIDKAIVRDFVPAAPGRLCVLHRRVGAVDIYYVFNRDAARYAGEVFFRASGRVCQWDAWTGAAMPVVPVGRELAGTRLHMVLEPSEAKIIVFGEETVPAGAGGMAGTAVEAGAVDLAGDWESELVPTMDNRFGDFRLPSDGGMLGAEARQFRSADETRAEPGWQLPSFDDSQWNTATCSFGARFLVLGPLPPGTEVSGLEQAMAAGVDPAQPVLAGGKTWFWKPYEMSLRWGIENDPFMKDWASGPHGLKKEVPLEFLDANCDEPGSVWYFWSTVPAGGNCRLPMVMGSRSAYSAWLNGRKVLVQGEALPPGRQSQWNLPHYRSEQQAVEVELNRGCNPLLLKFCQPEGQRVRGYVAFDPPPGNDSLALRWFSAPGRPEFNCFPEVGEHACWYRFASAPGLVALAVKARGRMRAWVDGAELALEQTGASKDGIIEYRGSVACPAAGQSVVALRVELPAGSFAGDGIPEPVRMECGKGKIRLGDWSEFGLGTYSGIVKYRKRFIMPHGKRADFSLELDLGEVAGTAEAFVNGRSAGVLVAPPWRVDVAGLLVAGENVLEVAVANTLANHYSVGYPTPYVYAGQTVSGLLGPVRVRRLTAC